MALDWVIKLRSVFSPRVDSVRSMASATRRRKAKVGILAFEAASLMSKLLHLWRSLSDAQVARLRRESIALPGVRRVVSNDDAFLLALASAELAESLRLVGESVSALAARCADPGLLRFGRCFEEFAESGRDVHRWAMSWTEMDAKARKMDRYVSATAALYKEMDQLWETELALKRLTQCVGDSRDERHHQPSVLKMAAVSDLQHKLFWHKQEVKHLKETSLWGRSFDVVTMLLARSAFTVLSRLKHAFGLDGGYLTPMPLSSPLPRSLSVSAAVHPSCDMSLEAPLGFSSGPLVATSRKQDHGFFDAISAALQPPPGTLGDAALALQYSNIIVLIERMIQCPRSIGADARDELYAMLPVAVRSLLRSQLRGVGRCSASDAGLAEEWRAALARIVGWLAPLAHNTLRWQAERSFEQRRGGASLPADQVLLLQTLCFADREKTEATVVELLVGLNYVWRFEIEVGSVRAAALTETAPGCHLHG
ncbi:hypothetical protein Taro_051643 [Colocasia esculenta]|uniref:Uncharacterized protein n=1 Tax=Colocasia esculenta TaxID=4460 RepID=A0A843XGG9_COLES|nr:hypothetical protein [Colocasia esculenta]